MPITVPLSGVSSAGSPVVSITSAPSAGDVAVYHVFSARGSGPRGVTSVSGLGGTWVALSNPVGARSSWWICTNPSTSGPITCVFDGGTPTPSATAFILRGMPAGYSMLDLDDAFGDPVSALTGPIQQATNNQIVLSHARAASSPITFPSATDPASGWVEIGSGSNSDGAYRIPATPANHRADATCGLAGMMMTSQIVLGVIAVPSPPTDLILLSATSNSLTFDWTAASGATSYDYRINGGVETNIGNVTDYTVTGLTFETEYTFEVRGVNSSGPSSWVSINATTLETNPGVPTNLELVDATTSSLTFSWAPPAPGSGSAPLSYERRLDGGAPLDIGLVTEIDVTGLNPATTYVFEVRAVNAVGPSAWAAEPGVTDEEPAPPPADIGIVWDKADERYYIHGVDRGVLYISGKDPVPWNGLIGVDETGDASRSILYRDGQIYLADFDPGDFEGSVNAFFYPDAFAECLGIPEVADGFYVDNQKPKRFGLSYRSLIGSGTAGDMFGYQIHLVYNAVLQIGTRAHKTKTNQVGLMEMSFDMVATPVKLPGMRPTAHYIIDTRNMSKATLNQLEVILYGSDVEPGSLPNPAELFDLLNFGSAITFVDHGDGTWTGSGSYANVHMTGDGTWEILNVNGVDNGDGTYLLQDTP